jgi:hypothetical protein
MDRGKDQRRRHETKRSIRPSAEKDTVDALDSSLPLSLEEEEKPESHCQKFVFVSSSLWLSLTMRHRLRPHKTLCEYASRKMARTSLVTSPAKLLPMMMNERRRGRERESRAEAEESAHRYQGWDPIGHDIPPNISDPLISEGGVQNDIRAENPQHNDTEEETNITDDEHAVDSQDDGELGRLARGAFDSGLRQFVLQLDSIE